MFSLCVSSCVFCYKRSPFTNFMAFPGKSCGGGRANSAGPPLKTNISPDNPWLEDEISFWKWYLFWGHVNFWQVVFQQIKSSIIAGYELEDLNGNFTLPELYCRALCSSRMDCAAFEAGPFGWLHPRSLTVRPWKTIKMMVGRRSWLLLGFGNFSGGELLNFRWVCSLTFHIVIWHPSVVSGEVVRFVCVR